ASRRRLLCSLFGGVQPVLPGCWLLLELRTGFLGARLATARRRRPHVHQPLDRTSTLRRRQGRTCANHRSGDTHFVAAELGRSHCHGCLELLEAFRRRATPTTSIRLADRHWKAGPAVCLRRTYRRRRHFPREDGPVLFPVGGYRRIYRLSKRDAPRTPR